MGKQRDLPAGSGGTASSPRAGGLRCATAAAATCPIGWPHERGEMQAYKLLGAAGKNRRRRFRPKIPLAGTARVE
jgi:hypothetical protein